MRFALLVFYAAGTLAVPVPDERIPKAIVSNLDCTNSPFQPNTRYEYEYVGETMNRVEGTSESRTGLQLHSRVLIKQLAGCDFLMKLEDYQLSSKSMNEKDFSPLSASDKFKMNLDNPLIFTMKGKKITSIRPRKGDTTEAINIKRGILSTLQLDEDATTEADINGVCKTTITKKDGEVTKEKSLTDCLKRSRSEIGIQSASIKTAVDLKPLDSKSKCVYTVNDGEITSVDCEEIHLFRPFSAGYKTPSGAMTTVTQRLAMMPTKAVKNAVKYDADGHMAAQPIVYEHRTDESQEANKHFVTLNPQVDDVMNKLLTQSQLSATATSAYDFTSLVMMLRKMDDKMMKNVWEKYFDCTASKVCQPDDLNMKDLYRQYMLDAIAYCGTPSCVSVVKDVTISGEIAGERANIFLMSIALVAKTTDGMIKDVLDIAEKKPSRQVFMTLGTLISRHCAKSPKSCESGPVVEAEAFLSKTLGECSRDPHHERVEEIIMAIKAIGNAKRPVNAKKALIQCAVNCRHSNVTMAAFDALRGMSCDTVTLNQLNGVVADKSIDEEKRIYAFQASVKCASKENLAELIKIYNAEEKNQVSSFVWTHLSNLKESSNPQNKEAREVLTDLTKESPLKITNLPIYSHSRNIEKSLYVDYLKAGVSAKANLVFNPENVLPKTALFDMTANVMGVPVDLVETVVGIDGVESLLENVALPEAFAFDMFKMDLAEKIKEMQAKKQVVDRIRRKAKPELPKPKQFSGFMAMKVMGQEIRVMSYDDIAAMIEEIDNMNVIQLLSKIAKGGAKTFSKSMMFLEMTYTVPTGFGLPLKLKLTGSTVGTIELNGKLDMRNMFWGPGALTVNGLIKPTAVVDISGKMGIESDFVSTGLMVSSNMMVSNVLKGSIQYKAGQLLKVNVDTPTEPVQLFKSSSTPYMYVDEQYNVIEGVSRTVKTDKCLKSQIIGYGLCTSLRVPIAYRNYEAPYYPLTGPTHFGVTLVRGDPKLTTFEFLMSMTRKTNALEGVIQFSAPGAEYERKLNGKVSYTNADNKKVLKLSAEPYGKSGSVEFVYDSLSKSASIQAKNNFITSKDIIATVAIKNQTNAISTQYGIVASLQHGSYKAEHAVTYMKKSTGHKILTKTTYAPNKALSAALEFNRIEKKVTYNVELNQFNQAVELSGRLGNTADGNGLIIEAIHTPSKKTATFHTTYKFEDSAKEITTFLSAGPNTMKNTLGLYQHEEISSIENNFVFNKRSAKFVAALENKEGEKSVKFSADVFGKTASSKAVYSTKGSMKLVVLSAEALGKTATLNGLLDNEENKKSLILSGSVAGKKAMSSIVYKTEDTKKTIELEAEVLGKSAKLNAVLKNTANERSLVFNANVVGKKATSTILYSVRDSTKVAAWSVDVAGKTASLNGEYDNKDAEKSMKITAEVMGKKASTKLIVTNLYDRKSIKMVAEVAGKSADVAISQIREDDVITLQIEGSAAGKSAKLFWKMEKLNGYKSAIGYVINNHVGGIKTMYMKDEGRMLMCADAYYGTTEQENNAMSSCVETSNLSSDKGIHWRLNTFIVIPGLDKKVSLISDFTKQVGHVDLLTTVSYNTKEIARNEFDVNYADRWNSAVTVSGSVGKYDMKVKAYTKKDKTANEVRFEASSMGKSVEFVNRYEKSDGVAKVTSNVILNGKTLPVSTLIAFTSKKGIAGSSISVIIGDYSVSYAGNLMYGDKYGYTSELSITKKEKILFKLFDKIRAVVTSAHKEVDQKIGFVLMGKTYEYGWSLGYSKPQGGHVLVAKIQYSTNRVSTVTVSFTQDAKMASVVIIAEYIPTKKVSHSIVYNKEMKQLDVKIEFLPKMFANFMARLEKKDGYQLITSGSLEWKNFNAAIKVVNSYVNTEDKFQVYAKVNENSFVALTVVKKSPKTLAVDISLAGKTARLIATYEDKAITLELDVNGKRIFKGGVDYKKISAFVTAKGKKMVAFVKSEIKKLINETEKLGKELKEVIEKVKSWISVSMKTKDDIITVSVNIFGTRYKKLVFNKNKKTLSIQYKTLGALTITQLPETKAISFTLKGRRSSYTLILRADWEHKVASILGLVNRVNVGGIKVYVDKLGLNFKLIASENMVLNTIFSYTDNTLKMAVNRISNKEAINELTFEYVLSKNLSELIFKWNKDTMKTIMGQARGISKPLLNKVKILLHRLLNDYTVSYGKLKEVAIEVKAEVLKLLNKMDKAFDDFDFIAARDKIGEITLTTLKKASSITYNSIVKVVSMIDGLKERMPVDAEKLKELIKKIKPMVKQIKPMVVLKQIKEVIAKLKVVLMRYNKQAVKEFEAIKAVVEHAVRNFTETTRPVVEKAIVLIKDFKIRGKRIEDIYKEVADKGKVYVEMYKKQLKEMAERLKVKIEEVTRKVTEHIMKMKVPYTKHTVAEVIEIIKLKIEELKEKVRSLDVKKIVTDMKVKIMDYKIKGKTIKEWIGIVKQKIIELNSQIKTMVEKYEKVLKQFPETVRKSLHKLVNVLRKILAGLDVHINDLETIFHQVNDFLKPVQQYLNVVVTSVDKHFSPLYKDILGEIMKGVQKIALPAIKPIIDAKLKKIADFMLPLLRPLLPLYKDLKEQVRNLNVEGMKIGSIVDNQFERFDKMVAKLVTNAKAKLTEEMAMLNKMVETIKTATADQMVDKSINAALEIFQEIIAYVNKMYNERKEMTLKYIKDVKQIYEKVKSQIKDITSKPADVIAEELIDLAFKKATSTAGGFSSIIKQISELDLANPSWKAWTEADVINHLAKYGINGKIMSIIKHAKDANLTNIVLDVIDEIETFFINRYNAAYGTILEDYRKIHQSLTKIVDYLRSISKKDYDTWFAELKDFTISNEKMADKWVRKMYDISEEGIVKAYEKVKKLVQTDIESVKSYVAVAEKWYKLVAGKAALVYGDVKQPTINVGKHYSAIVSAFAGEQYKIIKSIIDKEWPKIYEQLIKTVTDLKAKLPALKETIQEKLIEVKAKIEELYGDFIAKYGDMTWEEIAMKLEKMSVEVIEKAKKAAIIKYKLISKKIEELKGKATIIYKQAIAECKKIIEQVKAKYIQLKAELEDRYKTIKPKVIAFLTKYKALATKEVEQLIQKIETGITIGKATLAAIYDSNKDKTLEKIYLEVRAFITKHYLEQRDNVHYYVFNALAHTQYNARVIYSAVDNKLKNAIIPEVKKEIESIINQTLRNSVIMTKEIIRAYTPYAIITRDAAEKAIAFTKEKIPELVEKVKKFIKNCEMKEMLKKTIAKIEMKLKEYLEVIKKCKTVQKIVSVVEEKLDQLKKNPTFIKMKNEIEKLIAKVEKFIKEKIDEVKKNPALIKLKEEIIAKIVKVKESVKTKVEEMKKIIIAKVLELKKNPTYLKIKAKIEEVIAQLKKLVEKILTSKQFLNTLATLKQLKISGQFTVDKLREVITPYLGFARMIIDTEITVIREWVAKAVSDFSAQPEETFWIGIAAGKKSLESAFSMLRSVKAKEVVALAKRTYEAILVAGEELVIKCTDEWTKNTAKMLVKEFKALIVKMKGGLTKIKSIIKDLPALMKSYYGKSIVAVKEFIDKHFANAKLFTKQQIEAFKKYWKTSAFKAFVDTPVWGEIVEEIKNHELVALVKDLKDMIASRLVVLKEKVTKIYNEKKLIVEKKVAELTIKAMIKYNEIKRKTIALYKEAIVKIHSIVEKAVHIFKTTTIAEMVAYVQEQYGKALKVYEELKTKLIAMKEKYIAIAKEMFAKYEKKVKEMYMKLNKKMMVYKEKLMKLVEKLSAKAKELYAKYRPIAEKKYKELVEKLTAKYKELKEKTIIKYKEIAAKTIELYQKYKTIIVEQYAKALKKWNESTIRAKLIAFKKMTIKQTIDALTKIPGELKVYITKTYHKIAAMIKKIYKELNIKANALYTKYQAIVKKVIKEVMEKVIMRRDEIMKKLEPYLTSVKMVYKWVENEVKETAIFVYKYYGLLEKFNKVKDFTIEEIKMILEKSKVVVESYKKILSVVPEKLKKIIEEFKKILKKYTGDYKDILVKKVTQCVEKCKKRVEIVAKETVRIARSAGDKSLRAVHTGFVKADELEVALKKLMTNIHERVKITHVEGAIVIGFTHPEITPSFSHHIKIVKEIPAKVMEELTVRGKAVAELAIKKIKVLRKEVKRAIRKVKKTIKFYVRLAKAEAPVLAKKAQETLKRYIEILKAKTATLVAKVKEMISKAKVDLGNALKVIKAIISKIEHRLIELKETIAKNPNFKKLVVFIEKKLVELKKIIGEKINEGKEIAKKTMEVLKVKGKILMTKIQEEIVVLRVKVDKYIEIVKIEAGVIAAKVKVVVTKYVKIMKEKAGTLPKEIKMVVKKYVKIIKQKTTMVITKVKDFTKTMITKVKAEAEKAEKMFKIVVSKIEKSLKELKAIILKDPRFIKIKAFVEELLKKIKPIIDAIAQGKELKEKLMKKIEAKLAELKKNAKEQILKKLEILKKQAPIMIKNAVKIIKENALAAKENLDDIVRNMQNEMDAIKKKIESDERYIQFVDLVETKITQLKNFTKAEIEALKRNPTLLAMKAKAEKTLIATKEMVGKKYEDLKKQIPVLVAKLDEDIRTKFNQSQEYVKVNAPKLLKKLKALIEKIKHNEIFIAITKKIIKLTEMIKQKIEELKTNPTVISMKAKTEAMIQTIKKEIPILEAKAKDLLNITQQKLRAILTEKLNQLKNLLKRIIEKIKTNPTFVKYKTKAMKLINKVLDQIKEKTVELRRDIMTSYNVNKEVALRLYEDAKIETAKCYKKGKEIYSVLKKDAAIVADKVKALTQKTYVKLVEVYKDIANSSFPEMCTKVVVYGRSMYTTMKHECIATFEKVKPITEKFIAETIVALKRAGINMEKELRDYYISLKESYEKIRKGVPVKEVLKELLKPIFDTLKMEITNIENTICEKDAELCKLAKESWGVHKTLLKKYAAKIGGK